MNKKIKNYIDVLFLDIPKTNKAKELKEELLANMNERFEDYIGEGKSENQAYSLVISNLGDIDHLLLEVMPNEKFQKEANAYRKRNAKATAFAVMLYILGAAILILFVAQDLDVLYGVVILLFIAAMATGLLIYAHMSTPTEYQIMDEEERREYELFLTPAGKKFKEIESLIWLIVTALFFVGMFGFDLWNISWVIFPITGILMEIIKTLIRIGGKDE